MLLEFLDLLGVFSYYFPGRDIFFFWKVLNLPSLHIRKNRILLLLILVVRLYQLPGWNLVPSSVCEHSGTKFNAELHVCRKFSRLRGDKV